MSQIHSELSWSHYRCLLLVEDSTMRLQLEKRVIQEKLSQRDLLVSVKRLLASKFSETVAEIEKELMKYRLKPYAAPLRSSIEFIA